MHINACLSDSGKPKKVLFNNNIKNMHEGGMVSAGKLIWLFTRIYGIQAGLLSALYPQ